MQALPRHPFSVNAAPALISLGMLWFDAGRQVKPMKREADALAGEALIPRDAWLRSPASRLRSPEAAEHLAKQLGIHPAIVAGRMRHHWKAFRLLNSVVGHREVRKWFPEVNWTN